MLICLPLSASVRLDPFVPQPENKANTKKNDITKKVRMSLSAISLSFKTTT
jgi:hypothetical protein